MKSSLSCTRASRRFCCLFFAVGILGMIAGSPCAKAQSKNVLIIIADDLNRMISPLGDPNAITPNLDRLAARSMCFDNASCQFPFCGPSRTSLFMGLYPWYNGTLGGGSAYPNPHSVFPDRVGLPEYFRQHGYWTASYGKTEHFYQPRNWEVQTADYRFPGWRPNYPPDTLVFSDTFNYAGMTGNNTVRVYDLPPNHFIDGVSTTMALEELTAHRASPNPAPFFVVVGMDEPHSPWDVPRQLYELYDPATIVLNDSTIGNWPAWALKPERLNRPVITEERRRDLFHAYLAAVSSVDYQVGRLLDYLDTEQLWNETIVVFFSDNGYSLCEHQTLYAKRNISRENISVPLMIHAPGRSPQGVQCHRQVELQDLFPTLIDLCSLPPYPRYLSGQSIRPLLRYPAVPWPVPAKAVLASPGGSHSTARIVQHNSLKIADGGGPNDIFWDHHSDPSEIHAEWHTITAPPRHPKWTPLLDALNRDFGFSTGQSGVFYPKNATAAPDRDRDGIPDSEDAALVPLGFCPWRKDTVLSQKLIVGPRFTTDSLAPNLLTADFQGGPALFLQIPGLRVSLPEGSTHLAHPLQLMQSDDLRDWTPSDAPYEQAEDGTFRWCVPPPSPSNSRRYYKLALPRL